MGSSTDVQTTGRNGERRACGQDAIAGGVSQRGTRRATPPPGGSRAISHRAASIGGAEDARQRFMDPRDARQGRRRGCEAVLVLCGTR